MGKIKFLICCIAAIFITNIASADAASCPSQCSQYSKTSSTYERCVDKCRSEKGEKARETVTKVGKAVKEKTSSAYSNSKTAVKSWTKGFRKKK